MIGPRMTSEEIWSDAVTREWARTLSRRESAAMRSAEQNADDASVENGFETFTAPWFDSFARTYDFCLDTMSDADVEYHTPFWKTAPCVGGIPDPQ